MRSGPVGRPIPMAPRVRGATAFAATCALAMFATWFGAAPEASAAEVDRVPLVLPSPLPPVYMAPRPRASVPALARPPAPAAPAEGQHIDPSQASAYADPAAASPDAPIVQRIVRPSAEATPGELRRTVEVGVRLEEGNGVPRNLAKAYEQYCRAARDEFPEALMRMGRMYATGRGRPLDETIANTLFRRAAGSAPDARDRMPDCLRPPYRIVAWVEPPVPVAAPLRNEPASVATKEAFADFFTANPGVDRGRLTRSAIALAKEFHLDPQLVLAVIRAESNFDPFAVSPKNAQGLMQLIPETAERFAVQNPFDPIQNMRGGMRYLRWLLSYFRGDVALAVAAYNAGEGAVDRHRGIPPYPETVSYVKRIRAFYPVERHPFDAKLVPPSSWIPDRHDRVRRDASPTIASE